jgi:hypothetical protein
VVDKAASSTFVAVTDRRIITAGPRTLLIRGELGETFPLSDVQFVRTPQNQSSSIRPTLDVITEHQNLRWIYPSAADVESVDKLAVMLDESAKSIKRDRTAVTNIPLLEPVAGVNES